MKKRYLKLVRQSYRSLRNKRLRKIGWLQNLIRPLFSRELWRPCKESVAKGLSIGMFFSMIPLPGQMLLACALTAKVRGNIPFTLFACWMSNPFTILPILILQERFGEWIEDVFQIEHNFCDFLDRFELVATSREYLRIPEDFHTGALILGVVASAILLSAISYPLVYAICHLFPSKVGMNLTPKTEPKN